MEMSGRLRRGRLFVVGCVLGFVGRRLFVDNRLCQCELRVVFCMLLTGCIGRLTEVKGERFPLRSESYGG